MTTKHTQGRWYLQEFTDAYTNIIRCDNGILDTLFIASTPQNTSEETRANAKLMAASPELLQALLLVVEDCEYIDKEVAQSTLNRVKEAIKKATI